MNTQFPPQERTPRSTARRAQRGLAPQERQPGPAWAEEAQAQSWEPQSADFQQAESWEDGSAIYAPPEREAQPQAEEALGAPVRKFGHGLSVTPRRLPRNEKPQSADFQQAESWEDGGAIYAPPERGARPQAEETLGAPVRKFGHGLSVAPRRLPRNEKPQSADFQQAESWGDGGAIYAPPEGEAQPQAEETLGAPADEYGYGFPAALRRLPRGKEPEYADFPPAESWEDTSTIYTVSESHSFFNRQSPLFWIVAAVLLISMLAVVGTVAINKWRELDAEREQARIEQQLADEKAQYKLLYRELIEENAYEFGIEPAVIAAVIYNESRFRPEAESYLGARGLMQIMFDTWDWIAGKLEAGNGHSFDDMYIPEKNIRYGTWYLAFLCDMFDGDLIKIAAGYHAGQHAVESWLANPDYSSDGKTLEYIPASYKDTDQYVGRVVTAYEMYRKHYFVPQEEGEAIEPAA